MRACVCACVRVCVCACVCVCMQVYVLYVQCLLTIIGSNVYLHVCIIHTLHTSTCRIYMVHVRTCTYMYHIARLFRWRKWSRIANITYFWNKTFADCTMGEFRFGNDTVFANDIFGHTAIDPRNSRIFSLTE